MDLITNSIIQIKEELFEEDKEPFNIERIKRELERNVNDHIQMVEISILEANDYNLNIGTGIELVHMIMN